MVGKMLVALAVCAWLVGLAGAGEGAEAVKGRPQAKADRVAFLGIVPARAPEAVRRQLDLPEGVGLLVEGVVPDGPGAKAGLERFDVLHKLDRQILINPEQLVVLVRMRKPGSEVKLTVMRKGEAGVVAVKLGSRDRRAMPAQPQPIWSGAWPPGGAQVWVYPSQPGEWVKDMEDWVAKEVPQWGDRGWLRVEPKKLGEMPKVPSKKPGGKPKAAANKPGGKPTVRTKKAADRAKPVAKERGGKPKASGEKPGGKPEPAAKKPAAPRKAAGGVRTKVTMKTGRYVVTVEGENGGRSVTVKDSAGKVLHQDLPEKRWGELPAEVRELLKSLRIEVKPAGGGAVKM